MGDAGPKFDRHVLDLGAREYFNLLILDRLSRKLDASCTIARSAEAFSDLLKLFRRGREGVTTFTRTCKPGLRSHGDTWRVN